MAKSTSTRSRSKVQAQKARADIARLRKAGLTKAKIKPKSRPGGSAYALLRKFTDVLSGKAAVVSVPPSVAKQYKGGAFKTTRTKVIVPKNKGEKPYLHKATGQIRISKLITPQQPRLKLIVPPKAGIANIPQGPGYRYSLVLRDRTITFDTYALMIGWMEDYHIKNPNDLVRFIKIIPPGNAA